MAATPTLTIRTARPVEHAALEALQRRAALANIDDRAALLADPAAIVLPARQIALGRVHVADGDGAMLGFAATSPREDGGVDLDGLFVEPGFWRRGVGRALVAHCAGRARAAGVAELHVLGNPHAEAFYRACGFTRVAVEETRFGPALRMVLTLDGDTPSTRP